MPQPVRPLYRHRPLRGPRQVLSISVQVLANQPVAQLNPSTLSAHLSRLIARWPKDAVRPPSVSVQKHLRSRLSALPTQTHTTTSTTSPSSPALSTSPQTLNALYSLLENRYQKAYPLPSSLRYPASQRDHYDALIREFQEAPKRGWWARMQKKIRGALRF